MVQTCVEEISENLGHSLSSILKHATCDVILFRCFVSIQFCFDASTSDRSTDGGSMVEVVVGSICET